MEARVIWNQLIDLCQTEALWDAQAYIVNWDIAPDFSDDEEESEAELIRPNATIFELQAESSSVASFFAQSLKDKVAKSITRDLRPYHYSQDGKSSLMFISVEEHQPEFQQIIKRLATQDYEKTKDIEEAIRGNFFLIKHELRLNGKDVFCVSGRKTFRNRLRKRINESDFPTSAVYFENGELKAKKNSYFTFDEDIDFLIVEDKIFIFNKHYFEQSTRFSSKMYEETDEEFSKIANAIFSEPEHMQIDLLTENPKKIRRKVTKILKSDEKLYESEQFLEAFAKTNSEENWGYVFEKSENQPLKMRFPHTDEKRIDDLFTILNDGRLFSKLSHKTYDTQDKKEVYPPDEA